MPTNPQDEKQPESKTPAAANQGADEKVTVTEEDLREIEAGSWITLDEAIREIEATMPR